MITEENDSRKSLRKTLVSTNPIWVVLLLQVPAFLTISFASLISTRWLDGLFGVTNNTSFQTRLVFFSIVFLLGGALLSLGVALNSFRKRYGHDKSFSVIALILAFAAPYGAAVAGGSVPAVIDLSRCNDLPQPANLFCDEREVPTLRELMGEQQDFR